jgi:DmsE family decaheme c-type cytochrome
VWQTFHENPHFKSIASGREKPQDTGCEGCHGPGDQHVQAVGGKTTITAFSDLSRTRILDACLRCHAQKISRTNIRRSSHTLNDVVCTDCHLIHGTPTRKFLLAKAQTELCYGCHANVRADFSMPFKHRVNEGFMTCTDCHNPHGSFAPEWRLASRPRMTGSGASDEEPCLKCHSEKRGPFAYEHPPVRIEGCEICHAPHGSTNSRLLRRPVVFTMCLECHNGARGFGLHGTGDPNPSASHNMTDPRYQNCTNCHVRIHGSNSDSLFRR